VVHKVVVVMVVHKVVVVHKAARFRCWS